MHPPAARSRTPAVLGLLGGLVALWTGGTVALLSLSDTPPRSDAPSSSYPYPVRATAAAPVTLTPFPRSLAELRAINADATRLRPDARFVAAFADAPVMITGAVTAA